MLTRLKISGFKNLVDVDVRFGPFTCIAGANGVGKSNLFDAIRFLSALADTSLMDAALSVRDEGGKLSDIRNIFHRTGQRYDENISLEAEMIIPGEAVDDLGQKAKANMTFLRYSVTFSYKTDENRAALGYIELIEEKLGHIKRKEAPNHLRFRHSAGTWRKSVLSGKRGTEYISTETNSEGNRIIKLHQDGSGGLPKSMLASSLPRTVLSTVNAIESPTALVARREMQSWRLLQLEPAALREPDSFTTTPGLLADGSHLPATLYAMSRFYQKNILEDRSETWVYDQIANRLSELLDDVHEVCIDRDEKRELLTLMVKDRSGTSHPARALSDGTLRFLALAVLELDPEGCGVICLEEPENGIHPDRIPAILELLNGIAVDVDEEVGPENPLRQVIINTHSPRVVGLVEDESLLVAESKEMIRNNERFKRICLSWLPNTWRSKAEPTVYPVARGKVLAYLDKGRQGDEKISSKTKRVMDREDLQMNFPFESKS